VNSDELEWLKYEKARAAHERNPSLHPMPPLPWQRGTHIDNMPIEHNAAMQEKRSPALTKEESHGKSDESHTQSPSDERIPEAVSEPSNDKIIHRAGIGLKQPAMIRISWWVYEHCKDKRLIYPAIITVLITGYFLATGNPFAPHNLAECREEAARSAKSREAMHVLLNLCNSKFPK
jgi:hypothetical protein